VKTTDRPVHETYARLAPDGSAVAVLELTSALGPKMEDYRFKPVIYDLTGRRNPISLPLEVGPYAPFWSPDGRWLTLAEFTGDFTLWDRVSGRLLARGAAGFGRGSGGPAFLPAGDGVIAVCGEDERTHRRPFELVVWKPATTRLDRRPIPNQGQRPVGMIVVAPDGRSLAYSAGTGAILWDVPTLRRRFLLLGHGGDVWDWAFSPDGRTLATASLDKTVRLWSVASGQELLVLDGHTGPVRTLAFSPDGRILASCADGPDGGIEVIAWYTEGAARAVPARPGPPLP
jgi:WD40 repeat protein